MRSGSSICRRRTIGALTALRSTISNAGCASTASPGVTACFIKSRQHSARSRRDRVHRNFKASAARTTRRTECAAQSELLHSSAVPAPIRAADFLRSRSERNFLLDDEDGAGAIASSRILDDRAQCSWARLPAAKRQLLAASLSEAQTFYPLGRSPTGRPVENVLSAGGHKTFRAQPRPRSAKFTTVGQWYWSGGVEVEGEFPDLSKKFTFERYVDLPRRVPEAHFELAMNINADDPERSRLQKARLAYCRSAPRRANAGKISALSRERAG